MGTLVGNVLFVEEAGKHKIERKNTMIKMIAAVSENGVIGIDNDLPWVKDKYADDLKFFRHMTKNSVVVMGRRTFESVGSKPLPKRENRIVSRDIDGQFISSQTNWIIYASLQDALDNPNGKDIWIIGGQNIYTEGLNYCDEVYTTLIPEKIDATGKSSVARFPYMHPLAWDCEKKMMGDLVPAAGVQKLIVAIYRPSKTIWKTQ